jgi:hypothetical protein
MDYINDASSVLPKMEVEVNEKDEFSYYDSILLPYIIILMKAFFIAFIIQTGFIPAYMFQIIPNRTTIPSIVNPLDSDEDVMKWHRIIQLTHSYAIASLMTTSTWKNFGNKRGKAYHPIMVKEILLLPFYVASTTTVLYRLFQVMAPLSLMYIVEYTHYIQNIAYISAVIYYSVYIGFQVAHFISYCFSCCCRKTKSICCCMPCKEILVKLYKYNHDDEEEEEEEDDDDYDDD